MDEYHFLSVYGSLGYEGWLTSAKEMRPAHGVSPSIGLSYRLEYKRFLFDVGANFQYAYTVTKHQYPEIQLRMRDTEGEEFLMKAHVNDCRDVNQVYNVNIPIMFGYGYRTFYCLAGASLGLNIGGSTSTKSTLTTTAVYDRLIGEMGNMPNHELYKDKNISSNKYSLSLNPLVKLHFEIGGRVDKVSFNRGADEVYHKCRVLVGAFADYGLLNIHKNVNEGEALCYQETNAGVQFYAIPAMVSQNMIDKAVNPLTVGVKCTLLFELPRRRYCIICNESHSPKKYSSQKNNRIEDN